MSTVKRNITQRRFALLAVLGESVFHVGDLANLWEISDKNTLHTTLKRYVEQGLLFRVFRGLYAIKPLEKIDPLLLGVKAAREFAYVSTETILSHSGIILQEIPYITLVAKKTKKFSIAENDYKSRQMNDMYLFNPAGIEMRNGVRIATVERAVADMLYFNPRAYFDGRDLIDWKKVKETQKQIGFPISK